MYTGLITSQDAARIREDNRCGHVFVQCKNTIQMGCYLPNGSLHFSTEQRWDVWGWGGVWRVQRPGLSSEMVPEDPTTWGRALRNTRAPPPGTPALPHSPLALTIVARTRELNEPSPDSFKSQALICSKALVAGAPPRPPISPLLRPASLPGG